MLDGTDMKIGPFSQYVRRAGTKKLFSLKMLYGTSIKKAPFTQYDRQGLVQKGCFH